MGNFTTIDYLYAALFCVALIGGVIGVIYRINIGMRRSFKKTGDDRTIEKEVQAGDTLHAEGIYGRRHPEEGGLPLEQEKRHRSL